MYATTNVVENTHTMKTEDVQIFIIQNIKLIQELCRIVLF